MSFRNIPRNYKVRIRIYDEQGQLHAEGLDFIDIFRSRKIRMAILERQKITGTELMELDFKTLPRTYGLSMALFSDRDEWLGEAKMGMEFIDARREYYDECGLEFNMSEIWRGYFESLDPQSQKTISNGSTDAAEDQV